MNQNGQNRNFESSIERVPTDCRQRGRDFLDMYYNRRNEYKSRKPFELAFNFLTFELIATYISEILSNTWCVIFW